MHCSRDEFEALVSEALDTIPPGLAQLMDNVVVFVEDEPPSDEPELLGVYDGIPLTERGHDYMGIDLLPDSITIFRGPLQRMCDSRADIVDEVRITVVHEIAHHFGIDDDRLHALGWA